MTDRKTDIKLKDISNRNRFVVGKEPALFQGFIILLMMWFPLVGNAQQVNVNVSLSKDTILIGDQLDFTLQVHQPDTLKVSIPSFTDSIAAGLDIVKVLRNDTVRGKKHNLEIILKYRVIAFDTGLVVVDPVEISYMGNGLKATLETRQIELYVKSLPVNLSKGPKDIKSPVRMPVTFLEILIWFMVFLLLALAVYYAVRILKKRKRGEILPAIKRKPAEPAHVFALRELNVLKDARLWQQGKVKEYYTRLTDILRTYVELRYHVKAPEQTTSEILQSLKNISFNDNRLYGILQNILETGDLVKFAKFKPEPDVNESVLLDAFVFVNETKEAWKKEKKASAEEGKGEETIGENRDMEIEEPGGKEEKDNA